MGGLPFRWKKGCGAVAWDAQGREYIDFGSGIGVNSLGFADPEWAAAVAEQAARIQHISNLYYNEAQSLFAKELCAASGMNRVFLANSGAEANECAVKLAPQVQRRQIWRRPVRRCHPEQFLPRPYHRYSGGHRPDSFHQHFFPFTGGFRYVEPGTCLLWRRRWMAPAL